MEINRFNVVLEKFQQFCFDLKVFKKVIPDRSNCVAGAFQTRQLTDSADFTVEWLTRSYISLRGRRKEGGGEGDRGGEREKTFSPQYPFLFLFLPYSFRRLYAVKRSAIHILNDPYGSKLLFRLNGQM